MSLSVGIVGLPNVGKSTLFNAITNGNADAQNYPFCTIEPNTGTICIPNNDLKQLAQISQSKKTIFSTIEFVDIAGLVKGASKNEGLGNQFLSCIREVSVIVHVVRCFEEEDIIHVNGKISPQTDIDIIETELLLSDIQRLEKFLNHFQKKKNLDQTEKEKWKILEKILPLTDKGIPIRQTGLSQEENTLIKEYSFLTNKAVIYIANLSENDLNKTNSHTEWIQEHALKNQDAFHMVSAKIEEEISQLEEDEKIEFLKEIGLKESGLDVISKKCFDLLNLQNYFTTGPKESHSWTISKGIKAPQAAGVIHSDFERGFIRANVVSCEEFIKNNGWKNCKEKGLMRQEGKDYIMQAKDVVEFLFNV